MDNIPDTKMLKVFSLVLLDLKKLKKDHIVEITKHDTYEKDIPVVKGLFDPRMGVTDMGKICKTCGQKNMQCPGHFGHVELARPVYHYHFINTLVKILKCVCFSCGKLLINKNDIVNQNLLKLDNDHRFNEVYNQCQKVDRCGKNTDDGCGCLQPHSLN